MKVWTNQIVAEVDERRCWIEHRSQQSGAGSQNGLVCFQNSFVAAVDSHVQGGGTGAELANAGGKLVPVAGGIFQRLDVEAATDQGYIGHFEGQQTN
jgi:hypothetical protein